MARTAAARTAVEILGREGFADASGAAKADPRAQVVALAGDSDFPFMSEELATEPGHAPTSIRTLKV
ncbi:thiamine pyrophosphate-dependent enzyme [Streptomyces viridosporus]|uniref:thiamine pyrophosphate-dependent enzyme n=1 Tax=Streptomyces viridosporus TaxID=67581 RepID=UPI00117BE9F1|nr:thiamine pyrophosphate-dependent enzyme [Streptomyces viridosporus]